MSEETPQYEAPPPRLRPRSRLRVSMVWLVPLVAALVGLGLVVRSVLLAGPTITISFKTAQGLEAGKTEVKYKDVVVGRVRDITLDQDFKRVLVTVELRRSAARIAVEDTRFWVVRPRIDWGGVSGLNTLLSGAYIGVDIGTSAKEHRHFVGLDNPPAITHQQQGSRFVLKASDVGSLNIGSPVYYRRIAVGRVATEQLDEDGQGLTVTLFIEAPYDRFVTQATRFWNASGVDLTLNPGGLKLDTQSLITVLAGGVAFADRPGDTDRLPVAADAVFRLYGSRTAAMAQPDGPPRFIRMRFDQSVRGLRVGSEVDFRGIDFGRVTDIELHYDPAKTQFWSNVDAEIYPDRLGAAEKTIEQLGEASGSGNERLLAALVQKGMRAQLRTGNLITGQLYVALDFFPHAKPVAFDAHRQPVEIPTVPGSLEQVQTQIQEIVRKLDAVPYAAIGDDLRRTLRSADLLMTRLDGELAPQARQTLLQTQKTLEQAQRTLADADDNLAAPDAPLQSDAARTLEQVRAAAQSLRQLADFLQRHPEALLRGKSADPQPVTPSFQPDPHAP